MKKIFILLFLASFISTTFAIEQTFIDLPASVEVLPDFNLSLDKTLIDFGMVDPRSPKILGEGGYFNELRCRSNYARTWYVKVQLLSGPHLADVNTPALKNAFKFKIPSAISESMPSARSNFEPFTEAPKVIYISQGPELLGKEVKLRFQYMFAPPPETVAGTYNGEILFTLTETP